MNDRFRGLPVALTLLVLFAIAAAPASASTAASALEIDRDRGELRLTGIVQKNPGRPAHTSWDKKSTAFVGVKGGSEEEDFIVLLSAPRDEIYRAAREDLGWQAGRTYSWGQSLFRRGLSKRTDLEDFMTGDPILVALEFNRDGKRVRLPLEDAVQSRVEVEGEWVERPYTPHFVFTGAGEVNRIHSGCVACPSDCVGSLLTDNRMPVQTEFEEYRIDWSKLPPPGSEITVILRSFR